LVDLQNYDSGKGKHSVHVVVLQALVTALREQFKRFPGLTRDAEQILDSGRPILKIHVSVAGTGMTVERAAGVSDVTIAMRLLAQFLKRYWEQKVRHCSQPPAIPQRHYMSLVR
jgi:hypothetical protein